MLENFAHNLEYKSYIEQLVLTNFRNYAQLSLSLHSRPVVLTGANGAGKTNILEAISLLSPGRGLRRAKLKEIEKFHTTDGLSSQSWGIWSQFIDTQGQQHSIGTGISRQAEGQEKRVVRFNGNNVDHSYLLDYLSILWITPELDRIFVESKHNRRRFLDRLIINFDPEHRSRIQQYEKIMRQRAFLMRSQKNDESWLSIIEQQMVELGTAIAATRLHFIEQLNKICTDNTPFPQAKVFFLGKIEEALHNKKALDVEEYYAAELKSNRALDAQSGITHFGPHRSDWGVEFFAKRLSASHCSTGEQKLLLLSVVLAAVRLIVQQKEHLPILLLDEVTAHLDDTYRQALFEMVSYLGLQAWFTGTDRNYFKGLKSTAQFYKINNGHVELQD